MLRTTHLTSTQKTDIVLSQYRLGRSQKDIAREIGESEEYVGNVLGLMYKDKIPVFPEDGNVIFAKDKIRVVKDLYDPYHKKVWKDWSDWWL